jgi:methyl-accepting chemotaxis protein
MGASRASAPQPSSAPDPHPHLATAAPPPRGRRPRRSRGPGRWFRDRGVRTKILLLLAVVAVVVLGTGGYAVLTMRGLAARTAQAQDVGDDLATPLAVVRREQLTARLLVAQAGASSTEDAAVRQELAAQVAATDAAVSEAATAFEAGLGAERLAAWDSFRSAWRQWTSVRDEQLLPAALDGERRLFGQISTNAAQPAVERMEQHLDEVDTEVAARVDRLSAVARDAAARATWVLVLVLAAGLAVVSAVGLLIAGTIRRQVVEVQRAVEAMADGDLTVAPRADSADELGRMARAVRRAQEHLGATVAGVVGTARTVAASVETLASASVQVVAGSARTSDRAGVVAASAGEVSGHVQAAAAGAERLGESIREVARSAARAAEVAGRATGVAASTTARVARLGTSSQEIGGVVQVITTIAAQTNLLALNATIEAARAGEAGKGFAVVAGEVKDLAQETARATEDIARRVEAIQADTVGAVAAIEEIAAIIAGIHTDQLAIAGAVEQQTATTAAMSRSVAEAADGSAQIAGTITGVADAAAESSRALDQVGGEVAELARVAESLRGQVARFVC